MPRANRHYLPGHAWHITHRCHKKEFLLKFARDRLNWLSWLFEAKKRYGAVILNYTVTSNHVHLLVHDTEGGEGIPKTMQLVAGRTAQQYNQRKRRKGAFWEDRYHATAVQTDDHLLECIVYMDMNMVRAGVVEHPCQWPHGGYGEIQDPPQRYRLIDWHRLMELVGLSQRHQLQQAHRSWVEEALGKQGGAREGKWTESIAVGRQAFVEELKAELGARAFGRRILESSAGYELREPHTAYPSNSSCEMEPLRLHNSHAWHIYDDDSIV